MAPVGICAIASPTFRVPPLFRLNLSGEMSTTINFATESGYVNAAAIAARPPSE
jgi:hypothetical protein